MTEASAAATAADSDSSEARRIAERDQGLAPWDLWGSYLPDRQWGTVREDYSADGDAWRSFPHDQARSRVYRWGEDGLLGLCDAECRLCFSVALWNGVDPILKERPFGLGNPEGNHGEDIKDYYFHLANTPTHAFMRGLYRYPQRQFPYQQLLEENGRRGRDQPEYELIDTGIFEDDRYFDLEITYAKASATDILIRLRAVNRARVAAPLTLLPTLWLRNTWSWGYPEEVEHRLQASGDGLISEAIPNLGRYGLRCGEAGRWLFTDNETNHTRLYGKPNPTPFQKDGFHRYVIAAETGAVNPAGSGSKAAILLQRLLEPGEEWVVDLRLQALDGASSAASSDPNSTDHDPLPPDPFGAEFSRLLNLREQQWHDYFSQCAPGLGDDDRRIFLAASAGLLWCKKYYGWSVLRWLEGDPTQPPPPAQRWDSATAEWQRLHAHDVIAMPDAWEYPYFCQWDLMFHAVAFAGIDPTTAKEQCLLLRSPHYTAPNAQTPAYEWALSDPNPPIGAWAAMRIFQIDRKNTEEADSAFLARSLRKLLLEYGWWANRNDRSGDNVFDGGFLGLDNIAVFDRRFPLADGSHIKQCDGTAWMASLSLNLLQIAVELSREQPDVADLCERFVVDYVQLAIALNSQDDNSVLSWDEQDGFYYDVIQRPDGSFDYLRSRSITGLIPLLAVTSFDVETVLRLPVLDVRNTLAWLIHERTTPAWVAEHLGLWNNDRILFALVPRERLQRICERLFDEDEFLSPHGIRSLSKVYGEHPYTYCEAGESQTLAYAPADSPVAMFGGNSNWRGPVWVPINYLLIEALQKFAHFYGDSFQVEFPTRSGRWLNLWQVSLELEKRLVGLFRLGDDGARPFWGDTPSFRNDPRWRDLIQFNEYFDGDNGRGIGASHQTGWTAMVCKMLVQLARYPES
ncbi:glucosidase [Synechococcus sp. CBW1006]|uniref:MGH1-like glycoside hydrolase domain-containing protein n=1 Tax=Synechococcus sp. CBW1006 TaxID=1353138 RepID=UPI0018CF09B4|nr:glucosidase [Synechococcus sp. CBW1006]QPN66677.1 glucosidase [Synechococcus sp. CBW1006]